MILTGGIEEVLFSLTAKEILKGSYKAGDVVRHIRKGNIFDGGKEYVAVATASVGSNGKLSIMLMDLKTLTPLWKKTSLEKDNFNERSRF